MNAVERAIAKVLNAHLPEHAYCSTESPKMALKLCGLIRAEVKMIDMPRYKIVAQVRNFVFDV